MSPAGLRAAGSGLSWLDQTFDWPDPVLRRPDPALSWPDPATQRPDRPLQPQDLATGCRILFSFLFPFGYPPTNSSAIFPSRFLHPRPRVSSDLIPPPCRRPRRCCATPERRAGLRTRFSCRGAFQRVLVLRPSSWQALVLLNMFLLEFFSLVFFFFLHASTYIISKLPCLFELSDHR